jgi:L-methionine (R)-S-oxide reductase
MSEQIAVDDQLSKIAKYKILYPQLVALVNGETDAVANAANIIAALKEVFGFFWIGIYFVKSTDNGEELVLGPFQGPVACTRIGFGKGVCGHAWKTGETVIVADVEEFPGHIACNSQSRSEIVVPVIKSGKVVAVLDVDSDKLSNFSAEDKTGLEQVAQLFSECI